jgi:signal transduction histidine kinase
VHQSPVVLIITDDAEFARDLLGRWQLERSVPGFTVMSTELLHHATGYFDMAVVGPVRNGRLATLLNSIDTTIHPVICLLESALELYSVKAEFPRVLALQRHEGFLESVMLLSAECLKRVELMARLRKAEQTSVANAGHAALGRYMIETRHDFNNLLTSALGNAELLLLDSADLGDVARDQLETIHTMTLQMHEIMQRFSSLVVEIQAAEKQSQDETSKLSHLTVSAS